MRTVRFRHSAPGNMVLDPAIDAVEGSLQSLRFRIRSGSSANLRYTIESSLARQGWSGRVRIAPKSALTLTGMRGRTALCIQTGNMARSYADLLKLQAFFVNARIDQAVYLIPTKKAARTLGQNIANFERFTSELANQWSKVITVPIIVIGFEDNPEAGDKDDHTPIDPSAAA